MIAYYIAYLVFIMWRAKPKPAYAYVPAKPHKTKTKEVDNYEQEV